jgi:hypothetical protein
MELTRALAIQEALTENYLFAHIGQLVNTGSGLARENDLDPRLYDLFQSIHGIGVGKFPAGGYFLQFYHTDFLLYPDAIAEQFAISSGETVFYTVEPFRLQAPVRPLVLGCPVGHIDNDYQGSIGCFVADADGRTFLLSCYHVLFHEGGGYGFEFIIQPGRPDGRTEKDSVGVLGKTLAISPFRDNFHDAALAGPLVAEPDLRIGPIPGSHLLTQSGEPVEGERVYKWGAATGKTHGIISAVHVNAKVVHQGQEYAFRTQISIEGTNASFDDKQVFSRPGDSGATVIKYNDNQAVAMIIAGSASGVSIATPLPDLLHQLGVTLLASWPEKP